MASNKLWMLLAVSCLAGMVSVWFIPRPIRDQFEHFMSFVGSGSLAVSLFVYVAASRLGCREVTAAERFARRLLFKEAPPNRDASSTSKSF